MPQRRSFEVCPNCGAPTPRHYCDTCGQRNLDLHSSLHALIGEAIEEIVGADSRLVRTLFALFLRPGLLSREYRRGRRAHFTSPVKLYLVASALFFFLGMTAPPPVHVGSDGFYVGVGEDGKAPPPAPLKEEHLVAVRAFLGRLGHLGARANAQLDRAVSPDPRVAAEAKHDFELSFFTNLPRAMILLLPAFALLMKLLYWRRFLVDHLVFVLHLHAASFCLLTASSPLPDRWQGFVYLVLAIYATMALHTAYEQSWWKTVPKAVVFAIGSLALVVLAMMGLAAVEFLLF